MYYNILYLKKQAEKRFSAVQNHPFSAHVHRMIYNMYGQKQFKAGTKALKIAIIRGKTAIHGIDFSAQA